MKNVKDLNVKGLTVLVRCDFNVPFIDGKFQMIIELLQLYQQSKN